MKYVKRLLIALAIIIALLVAFGYNIMSTTGYFRTIEGSFESKLINKIPIPGAEDIVIDPHESFLIISSDDRTKHRDQKVAVCGLYYLDLTTQNYSRLEDGLGGKFHPHGIDMLQLDSAKFRILAVNHFFEEGEFSLASSNLKHSIEEFILQDGELKHIHTYEDKWIKHPNDVVIVDAETFYFTNDHGSDTELGIFAEDYLGFKRSGVVVYNGKAYSEVATGIAYANGIEIDRQRKLLFVASPRGFLIKVFGIDETGKLDFVEDIPCGTGVDNIEMDKQSNLWVGCHPNLLHFAAYSKGDKAISPSEIIKIKYRAKGDYDVTSLIEDDGSVMSAATVAIATNGELYIGNVMDKAMIRMRQ